MTNNESDLVDRLRASGTRNAPRNSNGVYMSVCDEAADALASIRAERDAAVAALKQCSGIFEDMYRYGVVYTPSADDKGEFTSTYYLGEGIMPMIARAIAGEQKND